MNPLWNKTFFRGSFDLLDRFQTLQNRLKEMKNRLKIQIEYAKHEFIFT